MLLSFQGGNVQAEILNSAFYFHARDLLAATGLKSNSGTYREISKRADIDYKTHMLSDTAHASSRYVPISSVLPFLDAIHAKTKIRTVFLMVEITTQFKKQL